jgi:tetratricopeptide (TPR) repeat protein
MLMANIDRVQGSCGKARSKYKKAIELFEALTEENPDECAYRGELALAYNTLGAHYSSSEDHDEAREYLKKAAVQYELASHNSPCSTVLNNYAWFLAICPEKNLRNADRAVELATEAVAYNPEQGLFWNTLGVAYYRKGKWDEAICKLKHSVKLRGDKADGFDWFFLAMAYFQKGNAEKDEHAKKVALREAERWYDKAVDHLADTNIYTEPIWPHCQEAAALLGKEPPEHKEKDCCRRTPKRPLVRVNAKRADQSS